MFSSDVEVDEIRNRIKDFRDHAENGIPDQQCIDAVLSIFGNVFSFAIESKRYDAGTIFFRARPIPNDDTTLPLSTIRSVGDAWEKPEHLVGVQGRLNSVRQSILYCCVGDPDLAIDEARARSNKHVAIMVYKSKRPIKVAVLGDYSNSNLPKDEVSSLFYSFLDEEFSKTVLPGFEGRYSITRAIADTFFNYPEQDAWCYRSVQSSDKFNIAFLPGKSKAALDLSGVMICDLDASVRGALNVKLVVDFDPVSDEARYHLIGSDAQKRIFPEIS